MSLDWDAASATPWVSDAPTAQDHKYSRGVLGARIGSSEFPGAAMLGVEAAWRTGLGMVRYLPIEGRAGHSALDDPLASLVAHRRPETVFTEGRTDAWLIGSGLRASTIAAHAKKWFIELLGGSAPIVIDAGALDVVARGARVTAPAIITPHTGEFSGLVEKLDLGSNTTAGAVARETLLAVAERLQVAVLLKGSVTQIATPGGRFGTVGPATPWLATAGAGDVLGGILGALAARHHEPLRADPERMLEVGLSAAFLHDRAARMASHDEAHPITALDVADAIPAALRLFAR